MPVGLGSRLGLAFRARASVRVGLGLGLGFAVLTPLVSGAAVTALLGGMPLLLFCRRGPTHDYLLCGRLAPVALAVPEGEAAEAARAEATAPALLWTTAAAAGEPPSQAAHVVFRLLDAAALQAPGEDALDQVLGGRALEAERPKHYVAQSTVGPEHAR